MTESQEAGSTSGYVEQRPKMEKSPLVKQQTDGVFTLSRSLSTSAWDLAAKDQEKNSNRTLGWLGGCFASVALGQLAVVVFQRVGK